MRVSKVLVYPILAVPWAVALVGIFWIAYLRFPPNGIFRASSDMGGGSAWINPFLPAERTTTPGRQSDGWIGQRVLDDPTYFTALVPGPYEKVSVEVEYRPVRQSLLEFGIVRDAAGTQIELEPMYSSELDSAKWRPAESLGLKGYVLNNVAASRLADPDPKNLALWDATGTLPSVRDPDAAPRELKISLRGSHDFYFVPTSDLDVTFTLQAVNRDQGRDTVAFRVFCGNEEVSQEAFNISGSRERGMGSDTEHRVRIPHAAACVYHVALAAKDDVFIRSIKTPSKHWVVGPRLNFGDVVGYATSSYPGLAWTNSRHAVAQTFHKEGLQTVSMGFAVKNLVKTHQTISLDRSVVDTAHVVPFVAPNGDLRIVGDGFFALRPDAFFEPRPRRLTDSSVLEPEGVQAVVTDYERAISLEGGWKKSVFDFNLEPEQQTLRFVLSAPGIKSRTGAVDVRRITLIYQRPPLIQSAWWRILRQELANAWHRL